MKTTHTQGEWKAYESENFNMPFEIISEGTKIARIVDEFGAEANAKLIAAAPEMIAQLEGRERLISGFLEKVKDIANSDKSQTKLNEDFMFLVGGYKRTFENALKSTQDVINKTK